MKRKALVRPTSKNGAPIKRLKNSIGTHNHCVVPYVTAIFPLLVFACFGTGFEMPEVFKNFLPRVAPGYHLPNSLYHPNPEFL